ncbi:MAG: hypothetical protein RL095_2606 [Verrucomicrobiota bacterium]|jgi:hypothetical protein
MKTILNVICVTWILGAMYCYADEKADKLYQKHKQIAEHFEKTKVQPSLLENIKIQSRLLALKRQMSVLPEKSPKLAGLVAEQEKLQKTLEANKLLPEWLAAWNAQSDGIYKNDYKSYNKAAAKITEIITKYKNLTDKAFPNSEAELRLEEIRREQELKRKRAEKAEAKK